MNHDRGVIYGLTFIFENILITFYVLSCQLHNHFYGINNKTLNIHICPGLTMSFLYTIKPTFSIS
jgi:hypothetical protein